MGYTLSEDRKLFATERTRHPHSLESWGLDGFASYDGGAHAFARSRRTIGSNVDRGSLL